MVELNHNSLYIYMKFSAHLTCFPDNFYYFIGERVFIQANAVTKLNLLF